MRNCSKSHLPAKGYRRIVIDLHRTQIKFLDDTAKAKTEALRQLFPNSRITRVTIIREAIAQLKQREQNSSCH